MEPDGSMVRHADLRGAAEHGWNEIVVDGRGNIYVNGIGFGFLAGEPPTPGIIALVTSDGTARKVADDLEFPNGMVITPDDATLIISESMAGRLTALISPPTAAYLAAECGPRVLALTASAWTPMAPSGCRQPMLRRAVIRIREGGEVPDRVEHDRAIFAAMLGGPGPHDAVPSRCRVARHRARGRGGRGPHGADPDDQGTCA
jgi:SMP-30/Gluconolactonase/LRE-like region